MKRIISTLVAATTIAAATAQTTTHPLPPAEAAGSGWSLYIEGGGVGGFASLNLERAIGDDGRLRAGGLYATSVARSALLGYHHLFLDAPFRLEIGGDLTLLAIGYNGMSIGFGSNEPDPHLLLAASAGLRYEPAGGGLLLRATLTPLINPGWNGSARNGLQLWGGASIGWSF